MNFLLRFGHDVLGLTKPDENVEFAHAFFQIILGNQDAEFFTNVFPKQFWHIQDYSENHEWFTAKFILSENLILDFLLRGFNQFLLQHYSNAVPKIHKVSLDKQSAARVAFQYEKVHGETLTNTLTKTSGTSQFYNYAAQICRILIDLQQRLQFVHFDLSTNNVMIAEDNTVRIIDFEYSYIVHEQLKYFTLLEFEFDSAVTPEKNYKFQCQYVINSAYLRKCVDLFYLVLTTILHLRAIHENTLVHILERDFMIFHGVNLIDVFYNDDVIQYIHYIYAYDPYTFAKRCNMNILEFEEFIMRFEPEHALTLFSRTVQE